jgi:hypothetical protein
MYKTTFEGAESDKKVSKCKSRTNYHSMKPLPERKLFNSRFIQSVVLVGDITSISHILMSTKDLLIGY